MRRSTTWTHNSQPESNANSSGVCLARSGCLAANRPASLFKQTPWGAREGVAATSLLFQWGAHIHFCYLAIDSACRVQKGAHNFCREFEAKRGQKKSLRAQLFACAQQKTLLGCRHLFLLPLFSPAALFVFRLPPSFFFCLLLARCFAPANTATFDFSLALRQSWMDVSRSWLRLLQVSAFYSINIANL